MAKVTVEVTALDKATKELKNIGNSFNGLQSKLAAFQGAFLKLGVGGAITGAVYSGFKKIVQGGIEYGDMITELSMKTGFNIQETQKWKYILERSGTTIETVIGPMTALSKLMESGSDEFKKMGVNINDSNGNLKTSSQVFSEVMQKLSAMGSYTERTALASKIFGKNTGEINALLSRGKDAINNYAKEFDGLGLAISNSGIATLDAAKDAQDRMAASMKKAGAEIAVYFSPMVSAASDAVAKLVSAMSKGSEGYSVKDWGKRQLEEAVASSKLLEEQHEKTGKKLQFIAGNSRGYYQTLLNEMNATGVRNVRDLPSIVGRKNQPVDTVQENNRVREISEKENSSAKKLRDEKIRYERDSQKTIIDAMQDGLGKKMALIDFELQEKEKKFAKSESVLKAIREASERERAEAVHAALVSKGIPTTAEYAGAGILPSDDGQDQESAMKEKVWNNEQLKIDMMNEGYQKEIEIVNLKYDYMKQADENYAINSVAIEKKKSETIRQIQMDNAQQGLAFITNNLYAMASEWKEFGTAYKIMAESENAINTYKAATASYSALAGIPYVGPALGFAAAATAVGAGIANGVKIANRKFAMGGDFVTSGTQNITVGDNPGGRERVQITPLSSPNYSGPKSGGGGDAHFHIYTSNGVEAATMTRKLRSGELDATFIPELRKRMAMA